MDRQMRRLMKNIHTKQVTRGMQEPHLIRLVCTGARRVTHKQSVVADVWVDKATGEWKVDDDRTTGNPANIDSLKRHERPQPIQQNAEPDLDDHPEMQAYTQLQELMADSNLAPSYNAHSIHCNRCKRKIERDAKQLTIDFQRMATIGVSQFNIAKFPHS